MRLKIFFVSIIVSIPLFWGINVLSESLSDYFYTKKLADAGLLSASINEALIESEFQKLKEINQKIKKLELTNVNSRAAISVKFNDQGEEKIFLSLNENDRLPIASITKLMTALVIVDNYDLKAPVTVSQKAVNREGNGHIFVGERILVKDLLNTMLIRSNNDAAYALAELIGFDAFVDLMNIYANKIGMEDTYYVNPTGLEPDNPEGIKNYSTAKDIVKLAKYILDNHPEIFEITSDREFVSDNTNKLLARYDNIVGGKTGWSPAASGCLMIVLKEDDNYYINVVLGANDRFLEMSKIINILND